MCLFKNVGDIVSNIAVLLFSTVVNTGELSIQRQSKALFTRNEI